MSRTVTSNLLGLVGAVIGGAVGYAAFRLAWSRGLYAVILPGGLLGMGCGMLALHRSQARGGACLIAGLILGLFSEWRISRWPDDLGAFVSHIPSFDIVTMFMIGIGALLAYWSGQDGWAVLDRFVGGRKPPSAGS